MREKYKEYLIVSVLWNDPHIVFREELPNKDVDDLFGPTLTVGLLYKKNKDFITLIHSLERKSDVDEADFTIIFNGCVIAIKEYGKIKLKKLRPRGRTNG